jgi:hypothetical protein
MNPPRGSFVPPSVEALEQRIAPAAAVLDPSSLNGSNGFKISGSTAYDLTGWAVSGAGDVNGDGFADLIVNAPYSDSGAVDGGTSYVIFGKGDVFAPNLEASSLGTDGFQISNDFPNLNGRNSISGAGDINGDGFDDLIIGLPRFSAGAYFAGACFVVFGKSGGVSPNLNLSSLDGNNGIRIGGDSGGYVGRSVSGTGDINGDGIDDLIIGGPYSGSSGEGASYVVFGSRTLLATSLSLASLDGANGFRIDGENAGDHAGISVSGAGDINGDGFRDLIIGARNSDTNGEYSGASYVVFGKAGGFSASLRLSSLDGTIGFKINGEAAGDHFGNAVSGAGDVNGDGFDDLIIGAPYARPNGNGSGASYIVFGGNGGFAASLNLSSLNGSNGFKISGEAAYDHLGGSVSNAGDINGDEFGDIIVGARGASPAPFGIYAGAGYVIFGKGSGFSASLDLTSLDGGKGYTIRGPSSGYALGSSVAGPGDINGDGFDDLLVGAFGAQPYGKNSGAAYVVFGAAAQPTISIAKASALEGQKGTSSLSFRLTLSSPSDLPVSVRATTFDGTASSDSDYTELDGELVQFAPGELTKTIVVNIQGDSAIEPNETFTIVLTSPVNADITNGTATGLIVNDDIPAATPKAVTFQEADGDIVTIKLKGGQIAPGNISLDSDGNISVIDLTSFASLANAAGGKPINLSVSVKAGSGGSGNGLAKVGFLNANGVGLGNVSLQGDLGQIVAGDGSGKAALKSLSVAGNLGGLAGFSQVSRLLGQMSKFTIGGSIPKEPSADRWKGERLFPSAAISLEALCQEPPRCRWLRSQRRVSTDSSRGGMAHHWGSCSRRA